MLFLIFFSIQWIDITRYFSILDYRSTGEIFFELRNIAFFLDASLLLDLVGISFFSIFFIFSITLLYIFLDYEKTKSIYEDQKKIAAISSALEIQESENRYFKEIQYLVHDLKTPLFSINTLIEILSIQEENPKKLEYLDKISNSLERCNIMISEILRDTNKNYLKIRKIFDFIFSYLSIHNCIHSIKLCNYCPDSKIKVNKIVFSRAIINLILNSYDAIQNKENANITIKVKDYINFIIISIEDNGIGMSEEVLQQISTNKKFSTKNSSGIGLNFVKTVIEEHDGKLFVSSKKNVGTQFYILLKKGEVNEKK
ncbi:MAG: HAMP domain-containing sensor histidine kinase [Fusobacterium gastrosuis]|nr:HAMP domain-containing sensor histidine kinase [uncultured Fusobacterium sp.]MDY5714256.1 HAMP domain-containing sensor histidine kinase [Fusobacterium gastrosuis]